MNGYSLFDVRFFYKVYDNSIYGLSPDELNAKPELFILNHTFQSSTSIHPGINRFGLNACLMFWVCMCKASMGKLGYKSVRIIRF